MKRFLNITSILISILVLLNISSFDILIGLQYFIILLTTFLLILLLKFKIKLNSLMLWVVFAALCSILLNDIPSFFKPFERFLAFFIVISLISPLIRTSLLDNFRLKLFSTINKIIVIMVVASAIGLITGLYLGKEGRSDFTGFFTHSMVLGPMAGISTISSVYLAVNEKTKKNKLLFFVAACLSFVACVAAGSRIALIGLFIALLFFIYKMYQGKATKSIRIILILTSTIIVSFPLWKKNTEFLMNKIVYAEEEGSLTATRNSLWEERLSEFGTSPIFGIGFATVDTEISSSFEKEAGKIEPGSSWLAVLSMTGLLGVIPLILILIRYFKFIYQCKQNANSTAYIGSLLILLSIHMLAEGYIFSAGSGMFFYLWLLIGIIDILSGKPLSHIGIIKFKKSIKYKKITI